MIIVTTEYVSGKEIETLGLVKGSTIQTVNAFKDIGAAFKTLVGGEIKVAVFFIGNRTFTLKCSAVNHKAASINLYNMFAACYFLCSSK